MKSLRPVDGGEIAADAVLNQKVGKRFVNKVRPVVGVEGSRLPVLFPQWLDGRQEGAEGVGDGVGGFVLQEYRPPQVGVAIHDEEAVSDPPVEAGIAPERSPYKSSSGLVARRAVDRETLRRIPFATAHWEQGTSVPVTRIPICFAVSRKFSSCV